VNYRWCRVFVWVVPCWLTSFAVFGQIDPVKRELLQFGYNGSLEGHAPLSAYAFYYWNRPGFLSNTNLTLRLAVAPTYLDSELGISQAIGPQTDIGIGVAGGGYADNYLEIRKGKYLPSESFTGYGGEASFSVYHLFNPGYLIPLNGLVRGIVHYSTYEADDNTAKDFQVPGDRETFSVRTGLRWGGREPTLFPSLAMELSIWYQGEFRNGIGSYGTTDGITGLRDRRVEPHTHLFWAEAFLAYTLPELKHSFSLSLTAGTSVDPDRFSAYRLGSLLPLVAEYPLSLPGYYYQELSAKEFVLLTGNYLLPLEKHDHWFLDINAATAAVDYLAGLEQPGHWHSGVGGGILYKTPSWKVMLCYAHGFDAIRSTGRGANSVGILMQFDVGQAKTEIFRPAEPGLWRGMQRVFGLFGS
jgi:hypothetical protein